MDVYYDIVYSIIDGKLTKVVSGYYGAEDNVHIQYDANGYPIYEYEWDGVRCSEAEYKEKLNQVYDESKVKEGYQWNSWYELEDMIRVLTVS